MLTKQAEATIPTELGTFRLIAFSGDQNEMMPHLAMLTTKLDLSKPVLVRIHSECWTGDVLGSHRCDCGQQLRSSLEIIGKQGGVLVYLRQEGRGIGLINKLKAYNLQDSGLDTVEANVHLGYEADERTYERAVEILVQLGIHSIRLLTNNPEKIKAIDDSEVSLEERVPIEIPANENNRNYLSTKRNILGHLFGSP